MKDYKIDYVEAYASIISVNFEIETEGKTYSIYVDYIAGSGIDNLTVMPEEGMDELWGEEYDAIQELALDYLTTIHRDADGNVMNGGRCKLDEILENIKTD